MEHEILSPNRKALKINLNLGIYGSFAEIGGGQEVARHFFQAGGASGTIAKTISAYDKAFSDALYHADKTIRYVSETRLIDMLETEYAELTGILGEKRGINTQFFSFANTVETLNFQKTNIGQGWIGMKFQLKPETEPNQVIIHVNLLENDGLMQQTTLGIFGVNFIYACFFHAQYPDQFLGSLLDNLNTDRLEITMIRMSGPDLNFVDNRILSLHLVKNGMTKAIMFNRTGEVQHPYDMLYQMNVLAFRGSFRPVTYVMADMMRTSYRVFKRDEDFNKEKTISLCEMTLSNLLQEGELDEQDFLDRVDILNGMGQNVMVSNFKEYYSLVQYFSRFKIKKLRIIIGIPTLMSFFDKSYYTNLRGGILEAMGYFFIDNMKLYVYPTISSVSIDNPTRGEELITSKNLMFAEDVNDLYQFLIKNKMLLDITEAKREWLWINSPIVIRMIKEKIPGWEKMVPKYIEKEIKSKKLFGYKE